MWGKQSLGGWRALCDDPSRGDHECANRVTVIVQRRHTRGGRTSSRTAGPCDDTELVHSSCVEAARSDEQGPNRDYSNKKQTFVSRGSSAVVWRAVRDARAQRDAVRLAGARARRLWRAVRDARAHGDDARARYAQETNRDVAAHELGISARVRSSTPSGARVRLPGGQSETVEDTGCAVRFSVSRRIGCCGLRAPLSLPGCAPKGLCASGFRFASSLARVGPSFVRAIAGLRAAHRSLREGDRWDCARRSARFARAIDLGLHARVRELSGRPGLQGDCVRQSVRLASAINWACMRAFESTPADLAFPS